MSKANKVIDGIEYVIASVACEMLGGISLSTLKRMRESGKVGFYQLNERCILYKEEDINSIKRSKHVESTKSDLRSQAMNNMVVTTNDGNLLFQGSTYIKALQAASKLRVTMEKLNVIPNIRTIIGPDGIKYFNKQDIDRLFVEGKRTTDKTILRG